MSFSLSVPFPFPPSLPLDISVVYLYALMEDFKNKCTEDEELKPNDTPARSSDKSSLFLLHLSKPTIMPIHNLPLSKRIIQLLHSCMTLRRRGRIPNRSRISYYVVTLVNTRGRTRRLRWKGVVVVDVWGWRSISSEREGGRG